MMQIEPGSLFGSNTRANQRSRLAGTDMAAFGILAVLAYILIARIWQPDYIIKAVAKAVLFVGFPILYLVLTDRKWPARLVALIWPAGHQHQKRQLFLALLGLTGAGLGIILLLNWLIEPLTAYFRLADIAAEIKARTHTNRQAMQNLAFYIPIVNALIEEFFFRGFLYLDLAHRGWPRLAMWLSPPLFALYHLAIFRNWFAWPLLVLLLTGLGTGGWLLDRLTRRYDSLWPAWLLHALINVGILSVSLRFF